MQLNEVLDKKVKRLLSSILKKKVKRFVSIDFGRAYVKIAYMESWDKNFKLLNYDFKKILSNEENRRDIVEFITNFLKTNAVVEKEAYLTIAEPDSVIIKNLTLPAMPKTEILEAAKLELKDGFSFDLEDAIFDWQIVGEHTDEEGAKKNEIMLILAKANFIDKYLSIVGNCDLIPLAISSGPFNYAHLLRYDEKGSAICALLDIGYKDTTLCIYKNAKLVFLRRLTFSSDKVTQSLTATLTSDAGKVELSYKEAENIKQTSGIPQEEAQMLENNIQAIQVVSLMRPLLEELVRELKYSFDYFTLSLHEQTPSILYITGGGANLKNLDKHLNKELKINVSKLPFPDCIDKQALQQEKLDRDQNQIISAAAVCLADAGAINLLPEEIRTQKVEFIEKVSLRLVAITAGAIFLFSLFIVKLQISDYQNRLKNARVHLETIRGIEVFKEKANQRENLLNKIQIKGVPVDGLLKLISTLVPDDIILAELFLERGRGNLVLKGVVAASEDIAESVLTEFMERIESSSFFAEASLLSSNKIGTAQGFEIKCDLAR